MSGPLRILIAEDNPADVELLLRELRCAGFTLQWEVVDHEPDFVKLLRPDLDLVLSDYKCRSSPACARSRSSGSATLTSRSSSSRERSARTARFP